MSAKDIIFKNREIVIDAPVPDLNFTRAVITEGLSEPLAATVEFAISDRNLEFDKLLGREMSVKLSIGEDEWREFRGIVTEIEQVGLFEGLSLYSVQLRSWFWLLTLTEDHRVFQDQSVEDIVKAILGENGFSNYSFTTSRTYDKRPYTVQYGESDFAFLSRLLEEEGLYYFSVSANGKETVHFVDGIGGHSDVPGAATIPFYLPEVEFRRSVDHIFDWTSADRIISGKVTLSDYNFTKPKADLKTANAQARGTHIFKSLERYRSPGKYRETTEGAILARVQMEAIVARHQTRRAVCNVPTMAVGATFAMTDHHRSDENASYLVTRARHELQIEAQKQDVADLLALLPGRLPHDPENRDRYRSRIDVIPKSVPFRSECTTPWPNIGGILLAKVVGPDGEEIHTDEYGRIRIQFPWDREGKNNAQSSCWVRCMMPWTGASWGFVAIPRIGQEVVIQFEDGNPDRPICIGMLYNAENMPPYGLPDNMTQSGLKTNSSKGGGGFNELMFEDKKGSELVRMQAEKDFTQIVKNNATITIGIEKKDQGNLTQTIQNNLTEVLKQGDHSFTVEQGKETRSIAKDQTETVGANRTKEIKADSSVKVGGNDALDVTGNRDVAVTGNHATRITGTEKTETTGSADWKVTGPVTIESSASITLKVGASKLSIDHTGIQIEGLQVKSTGTLTAEHSGGLSMVIKAAMVNIN